MNEFLVRVMVADDHPLAGHGIVQGLSSIPTIEVVAAVSDTTALVRQLETTSCDVLVLDYVMPAGQYGDGQVLVGFLRRRFEKLRIVTVTMLNSPQIFRALQQLGVQCIASKSDAISHTVAAVHAAYSNGRYLSPTIAKLLENAETGGGGTLTNRETEIVRLFREGFRVSEIAEKLHRSKKTVSAQKLAAMRKLGITRDADLIRYEGSLEKFDDGSAGSPE
ncbi:LuxR family transcriptional regulator [Burkholderia pseudomultivorans]|uniref:LuxR C-terminal-related transcriptional regulator n=1 Tax=Burkholderia pseudomultivorans TaxID=1207504 RepID=UPI000753D77B|nr:LuxR C-terminal-related transcriptional regulator [Burkholderia pseudomultivorans]KWI48444.1 LuxR family transcriptional regulator [Burkholderia pseudomultivorans]